MTLFELTVYGSAQPAGSKRALPFAGKAGGRAMMVDANKKARPWKDLVAQEAGLAMDERPLMEGSLVMELCFYRARPKGHFGSGRNSEQLKPSAPRFPAVKPDVLKLARAVEDALEGIVYRNDAQICEERIGKRYGTPERVTVMVRSFEGKPL